MKTGYKFLIFVLLGLRSAAGQAGATAPLSAFDLQIQNRIGYGASVSSLVVRSSHLYFKCFDSRESVVIETDLQGTFQNLIRTGIQKLASLDVDEEGNLYALSEDSWLTVFYPNGGIKRTALLEPNVLSLALVGGKPMIADVTDHLHFLEQEGPTFPLSAWPRPWILFGIGSDQVAIWRPQAGTISILQMEDGASTRSFSQTEKYITVAGGSDKHVYLLSAETQPESAQIQEFDNHLRPGWVSSFALPEDFHPQIMGISHDQIYLVNRSGRAVVYPLSLSTGAKALADDNPELITDLSRVRDAIKLAGYKSTVSIQLVVKTDGVPETIQIHGPAVLSNYPDVIAAVKALRFRPKIQAGSPIASSMTLEIAQD